MGVQRSFTIGVAAFALIAGVAPGSSATLAGSNVREFGRATHSRPLMMRHAIGLGPVVTSKFFGEIFGWSIDENGGDGVISEVVGASQPTYTSYVETFDQTSQKVTRVVRKQASGPLGNHELNVDAITTGDVALIDDENDQKNLLRRDTYYVMDPTAGGKITGTWKRPPGKDFLLWDIADQQTNPLSVMAATILDHTISQPPTFEVVVTDLAQNKILRVLHAPSGDGVNYPYLVAEDTSTQHAYVPAANYSSQTVFIDYDVQTGKTLNDFVAPAFSGPVGGLAIDSSSHMMCTTTGTTYSVQLYDITTKKQTFVGQIPNSVGELQAGSTIAADPINHLFLVEKPSSDRGGSEIYVYDERGNVVESIAGFNFAPSSSIQLVAKTRTGWVDGPNADQLQSFTY